MLRTYTNIEYITLRFLEREQQARIVQEQEVQGAQAQEQLFNQPYLIGHVYNQCTKAFINDLEKDSKQFLWLECVGIAAKLKFQEHNVPHAHIPMCLEDGVIEAIEVIENKTGAEMPAPGEDGESETLYCRCTGIVTPRTAVLETMSGAGLVMTMQNLCQRRI